jgi:hypothetical protein
MKFRLRIQLCLIVVLLLCTTALTHAQAGHLPSSTLTARQYLPLMSTPMLALGSSLIAVFPSYASNDSECAATAPQGTDGLHVWITNPTPQWKLHNIRFKHCIWLIQNHLPVTGVNVVARMAYIMADGIPDEENALSSTILDEDGALSTEFIIGSLQPDTIGTISVWYGDLTAQAQFKAVLAPGATPPSQPPDICVTTGPAPANGIQVWLGTTTPQRGVTMPLCYRLIQNGKLVGGAAVTATVRSMSTDGVMHENLLYSGQTSPYMPTRQWIEFGELTALNQPITISVTIQPDPAGAAFSAQLHFILQQ